MKDSIYVPMRKHYDIPIHIGLSFQKMIPKFNNDQEVNEFVHIFHDQRYLLNLKVKVWF